MKRRDFLTVLSGTTFALGTAPSLGQYIIPPGQVRLVFNENPYGPSPQALAEVKKILALTAYYPDSPYDYPIRDKLVAAIAANHDLGAEHLFVSSGSNEGLQAALMAYGKKGGILTPALTYDAHLGYAETLGIPITRVPLREDLQVDLSAMEERIDESVSVVYLANPNNPTGLPIDPDKLRGFCRRVGDRALVIVDEAYNELMADPTQDSMVDLVREGANVLVTRTFSKIFGLAGMRVGYGMGHPDIVSVTKDHVMAWPNGVGLYAAYHSYLDEDFIAFSREKILRGREMVTATFRRHGIEPLPSQASFVYANIERNADAFKTAMAARNVRIRGIYEGYDTYSRVSMGKLEDLEVFDSVFSEVFVG